MSISNNKTNGNYLSNAAIGLTNQAFSVSCWFAVTNAPAGGEFCGIWFIDNSINNFTGVDVENVGGASHLIVYNFLTFSSDLGVVTTNTPYYVMFTSGGTGGSVNAYFGNGGTLTKTVVAASGAVAVAGNFTVFNEMANDEPFGGMITPMKVWTGVQLSDDDVKNDYRQMKPKRVNGIWTFASMLNSGVQGTDWSGQAHTLTQTGTLPTSAIVPPVPWNTPMYMQ